MFKNSIRLGFICKFGGFFRYEFSMKNRSKYLGTDTLFFFNLFFAYSNFLDFTFRCVLWTKQQEFCTISSKKGTTVQHVFSCSISAGHKEFQTSFLRKNTFGFSLTQAFLLELTKRTRALWAFFPRVFRCQYLELNTYSVQPLKGKFAKIKYVKWNTFN